MKTEHQHAHILRAIADGEVIELRLNAGPWHPTTPSIVLRHLVMFPDEMDIFRIKNKAMQETTA